MSFIKLLVEKIDSGVDNFAPELQIQLEEAENFLDILRTNGYKIKLVTPTAFGTQVEFSRKYDDADVANVLKGFDLQIKGKFIFVSK